MSGMHFTDVAKMKKIKEEKSKAHEGQVVEMTFGEWS